MQTNQQGFRLPPAPKIVTISIDVEESEREEFNALLQEFITGKRYKQQVDDRKSEKERGVESLKKLLKFATTMSCGSSRAIASFLASLYNGYRFKFDLTDLRLLDREMFEDAINVLRLDWNPAREVHDHFEDGGRIWEQMIADYGLGKQPEN